MNEAEEKNVREAIALLKDAGDQTIKIKLATRKLEEAVGDE